MQTQSRGQKQRSFVPTPSFKIANEALFSKPNQPLVKYQLWFFWSSTRFPCDIFQQTLIQSEISKNKWFLTYCSISIIWQLLSIYSVFSAFFMLKICLLQPIRKNKKSLKNRFFPNFGAKTEKVTKMRKFWTLFFIRTVIGIDASLPLFKYLGNKKTSSKKTISLIQVPQF